MHERIVRETYTKEVKKRNFDETNRLIDQQISRGKYGVSEVPVTREEKPRKSVTSTLQSAKSDRTSRELQDMKKSIDNLQSLVISEMDKKRNESRMSTPMPKHNFYGSSQSLTPKRDTDLTHLTSELSEVKNSLNDLVKAMHEEKTKPVESIAVPVPEKQIEVLPVPILVPPPPTELREVATITEVEIQQEDEEISGIKKAIENLQKTVDDMLTAKNKRKYEKEQQLVAEALVPRNEQLTPIFPIPTKQDEEISDIKKAIENLQKTVDDMLNAKNQRKAQKEQQLLADPPVARNEIAILTQQLREQNEMLKKVDEQNKKATTQLHDEVGAALYELKDNTDHSIRKLAEQVADLMSTNENIKMRIDLLDETLRELCQDDATSVSSKSSVSTLSSDPTITQPPPEQLEKLSYTQGLTTSDYPVRKSSSSSMTSSSSGSFAVELPPDSMTDGRRPSQAYVHSSATRMSIAGPGALNPESSRFAEETAAKALNDATRIRL